MQEVGILLTRRPRVRIGSQVRTGSGAIGWDDVDDLVIMGIKRIDTQFSSNNSARIFVRTVELYLY